LNQVPESVFGEVWNYRSNNQQIIIDLDVTGGIDLVSEGFNKIKGPVDEDLTLIH
jgi:hypothetical protein